MTCSVVVTFLAASLALLAVAVHTLRSLHRLLVAPQDVIVAITGCVRVVVRVCLPC